MNYKTIDWNKRVTEEVYEYFDELPQEEDYTFFKWLALNFPTIDICWIEEFDQIREGYSNRRSFELCEDFVTWFPEKFPKQYAENYTLVERELCLYYLVHQNDEKLQTRLDYCAKHPQAGLNEVLLPTYFGLISRKKETMAFNLVCNVSKNFTDEPETREEVLIYKGIYSHIVQKAYEHFKETGHYDIQDIYRQLKSLKVEIDDDIIEQEAEVLQTEFDEVAFLKKHKLDYFEGQVTLNIHFMQYMADHYGFPFILSDEIWSLTMIDDFFGSAQHSTEFYYVDADELESSIQLHSQYQMNLNSIEMTMKVFGLPYVFEFLHQKNLLTAEAKTKMEETINYFQFDRLLTHFYDLWMIDFVFDWKGSGYWNSYREKFKAIFDKSESEVNDFYNQFERDYEIDERVRKELGKDLRSSYANHISDGFEPFERDKPKIGRNDPCPCGSGKKFKKCCLGKGIYD